MNKLQKYLDFSVERAVKTVAQVAIATIGVNAVGLLGCGMGAGARCCRVGGSHVFAYLEC
jgi:hypothetical protein